MLQNLALYREATRGLRQTGLTRRFLELYPAEFAIEDQQVRRTGAH